MLDLKTKLKRIKSYSLKQNIKLSVNDIRKVFNLVNSNYDITSISNTLNIPNNIIYKILKNFKDINININKNTNTNNTNNTIINNKDNNIIDNALNNREYQVLNRDEKKFFRYVSHVKKSLSVKFGELSRKAINKITDAKLEKLNAQQLCWIASVALDKFQILTGGLTANIGLELSDSELSQRLKILESERDLLSRKLTLQVITNSSGAAQVQDVTVPDVPGDPQEQEAPAEEVKAI